MNNIFDIIEKLESIPMITKDMIRCGITQGLIKFKPCTDDGYEVVCWIGDNWFYFAGMEGESMLAEEYIKETGWSDIEWEVYQALNSFRYSDDNIDEYTYYAYYLQENLIPHKMISKKKFKKYLMSKGLDRNTAENATWQLQKMRKYYFTEYIRSYQSADALIMRIEQDPDIPVWVHVDI